MLKKRLVYTLIVLSVYILGIATATKFVKNVDTAEVKQPESAQYSLLAKRVFIEDPNEPIVAFSPLRSQLTQYFNTNQLSGTLYFEYLPTGTSIRVGVEEKRIAASLIKLPFAMEAYYAKEKGLLDFNKKITLTEEMLDSNFGELYKKGAGFELTLEKAIDLMLKDSDNTALNAVISLVEGVVPPAEGVFNSLDAEFIQNEDFTVALTPRAYSSFLKCLYFSCYLDKDDSQKLLQTLSETHINNRLPALLPEDLTVSHKIGNYFDETQSDCGIIYADKRNFLLCIMLDGPSTDSTNDHIAQLSKLAYDYVKSR